MFKPNSTRRVWTTVYCMCICPKWTTNSTRTVYKQYTVLAQQHTVQEPTAHCWVLCLARNSNSIQTVYEQYTVPTQQHTVRTSTAHCLCLWPSRKLTVYEQYTNNILFLKNSALFIFQQHTVYLSAIDRNTTVHEQYEEQCTVRPTVKKRAKRLVH